MGRHGPLNFEHRAGCSIAAPAALYDKQRLERKHSCGKGTQKNRCCVPISKRQSQKSETQKLTQMPRRLPLKYDTQTFRRPCKNVDGLFTSSMALPAWAQQTRPRFASIHVRFERRAFPMQKRSHERAVDRFSGLSQSPIQVVGCADPAAM